MHLSSHSCKDVIGSKPQEKFEFEVVDEGLVNFNHHFSKKLQLESKDLNFLINLRVKTQEYKWF